MFCFGRPKLFQNSEYQLSHEASENTVASKSQLSGHAVLSWERSVEVAHTNPVLALPFQSSQF